MLLGIYLYALYVYTQLLTTRQKFLCLNVTLVTLSDHPCVGVAGSFWRATKNIPDFTYQTEKRWHSIDNHKILSMFI